MPTSPRIGAFPVSVACNVHVVAHHAGQVALVDADAQLAKWLRQIHWGISLSMVTGFNE